MIKYTKACIGGRQRDLPRGGAARGEFPLEVTFMKKRLFAILLCLCMVMSLLPTAALAEGTSRLRVHYDANRGSVSGTL